MDKKILNELNRAREIMGLGRLLEQEHKVSKDDSSERRDTRRGRKEKDELEFMDDKNPARFERLIEIYKNDLYNYVNDFKFAFDNDYSFWQNLIYAIGGKTKSIFFKLFYDAQTNYKKLATIMTGDYLVGFDEGKIPVRLLQTSGKNVLISYVDSVGDKGKSVSPKELCKIINSRNQLSLGKTQIVDIEFPTSGNLNSLLRTAKKDGLCLFSAEKITETYKDVVKVTQKGVEGKDAVVSAEGDPIKGGDAFEVYEVAPDPQIVENIVKQIKQGAGEGMEVVNVVINGVASTKPVASDRIDIWKANVGAPWNKWGNAQILKVVKDGTFTKPVTGNQLLAYLRAQNLGKALEKAGGIKVTNYNYAVGGTEMKVDVLISQEKPGEAAVDAVPEVTTPGGEVERVIKRFNGSLNKVVVEFPTSYKRQKGYRTKDDLRLAQEMIKSNQVLSDY